MKGSKDNTYDRKRQWQHKRPNTNMDRHGPEKNVHTASAMWTRNLKGRKDNTVERNRQGQHKRPNTKMEKCSSLNKNNKGNYTQYMCNKK